MKYEVTQITDDFRYTVRFFVEVMETVESGEILPVIKFDKQETFALNDYDTVEQVRQMIVNRANQLNAKFKMLQQIKLDVKGEIQ